MGANAKVWVLVIWILWVSKAGSIATKDDEQMVTSGGRRVCGERKGSMGFETGVWFSFRNFCSWKVQLEREDGWRKS